MSTPTVISHGTPPPPHSYQADFDELRQTLTAINQWLEAGQNIDEGVAAALHQHFKTMDELFKVLGERLDAIGADVKAMRQRVEVGTGNPEMKEAAPSKSAAPASSKPDPVIKPVLPESVRLAPEKLPEPVKVVSPPKVAEPKKPAPAPSRPGIRDKSR